MKPFLLFLLLALPALAQKDFLTSNEIDQVREVQEPVARIKLYMTFARQRLDQVQSLMARNRPGRSGEIRQLLENYVGIVDAINTVCDDALARKVDVTAAPAEIVGGEKKFLDLLQKIQSGAPSDLAMYDFDLKDAIEATSDSIDLANEGLGVRAKEVTSKAQEEKKQVDAVNREERTLDKTPSAEKAEAATEDAIKPARKPPTLYRPGEKPPDDPNK
jgi:hypothetical protein